MADRRIVIEVIADASKAQKGFDKAAKSATTFQAQVTGIGKAMKTGLAAGGIAVGASQVVDQLKRSVSLASNMAENVGKTNAVFEGSAQTVLDWSKTTTDAFAISERQALETASSFGALFAPIGLIGDAAAAQSMRLTELGADLASFYDTDVQSALDAIRSGLVGESEPLRRYGVQLSEVRVQAEAMAATGKRTAAALTPQEKTLARINIILADTVKAQGDSARSSDRYAFQTKKLAAEIENLQVRIGGGLIPVLTNAAAAANTFFDAFDRNLVGGADAGDIFGWVSGWKELNFLLDQAAGKGDDAAKAVRPDDIGGARGPGAIAAQNAAKAAAQQAAKAKADAARAKREFAALTKGLSLKSSKAELTKSFDDDLAASEELIRAIQRQIKIEGDTFALEKALTDARLAHASILQAKAAQAAAAEAAKASAAAERERKAREAKERRKQAAEDRRTARLRRQFRAIGLGPEGQELVPSRGMLLRRAETLRAELVASGFATPKILARLAASVKVLKGAYGKAGADIRSAVLAMYKEWSDAMKQGSDEVQVTAFQRRGVEDVLKGLGLSPEEIKALRQRLAKGGFGSLVGGPGGGGGTSTTGIPHGAGRGDVIVHGNLVVQGVDDVNGFVKEVQRRGNRRGSSRRGVTPGVNSGMG